MSNIKLDAKNLRCPMPIIELAKKIRLMAIGDLIEIEANDPVFKADLEAWCRKTKNELVEFKNTEEVSFATVKRTN